ncbi:hypothetical protein C4D60_Mb05t21110 [Musa balbisiana]|uniref:Remorin C-terminal domain-containing protein n=1 Tax=Musa balbisiana TaxID=52838 RepID=A0A4S8JXQ9_MUSBA|nr:hypothetical protein C4D60_Mb05t21110 [Musa balbisiana]
MPRAMLLGAERREEKELDFEPSDDEDRRAGTAESCKNVESSISTEEEYAVEVPKFGAQDKDGSCRESLELQKTERAPPHSLASAMVVPFSRPAPSKWDDAQKWITAPASNRVGSKAGGGTTKKSRLAGNGGGRGTTAKVILEVGRQAKKEIGGVKGGNWAGEPYAMVDSGMKPATTMENPATEIAVSLSQHDPLVSVKKVAAFIAPTLPIRSASMRDMGTEMSPIPSQEPLQTGSPARETSPPISSQPTTSGRTVPASTGQLQTAPAACRDDLNKTQSEEEMLKKACREIMILGRQLDNENIAACSSKEEETDASISLKTIPQNQSMRSVIEARAAAWEEAEQAKYLARFKREEIKIYAWKNHQKAKIEAEMRKIEVEVERTRAHALERLMNKVAAASHKAEKMRAAAQAQRNYQAATTAKQAEYIRQTGRIPSSFFYWSCCFKPSSLLKYDVF